MQMKGSSRMERHDKVKAATKGPTVLLGCLQGQPLHFARPLSSQVKRPAGGAGQVDGRQGQAKLCRAHICMLYSGCPSLYNSFYLSRYAPCTRNGRRPHIPMRVVGPALGAVDILL
jgi:hypothetical protein